MHLETSTSRRARLTTIARAVVILFATSSLAHAQTSNPAPATPPAPTPASNDAVGETVQLDQFTVSATLAPRRNLDTAAAITTIDASQMKIIAPVGLPELIKQIPGIMVNTAGGEARSNVLARGIPATGGFVFVGLQQDGLPDMSEMNFRDIFSDLAIRSTTFTERLENVRGGTSGVFQSNVPGGIINLISREGTEERRGELTLTLTDYNQIKTEAWASGPINKNTTYAAGLFYRVDDGIRSTGFKANKGYIIQGNVKHKFADERGFFKVSAKWMSDATTFFIAVPMQDASHPHSIASFDAHTGTQNSPDLRKVVLTNTPDGNLSFDTVDPVREATVSAQLDLKIADGWKLQNHYRYTDYLAPHSGTLVTSGVATPIQTFVNTVGTAAGTQFAAARTGTNYNYRLHYTTQGGAAVTDPTTMNGNGLGLNLTYSARYTHLTDNQNDLRIVHSLPDNGAVMLGLYTSWIDLPKARNYQFTVNTEVRNNPRLLDIEFVNPTNGQSLGYATYNGLRQVSVPGQYRNYSTKQRDLAPFVNIEQPWGSWTFDAGLRHEQKKEDLLIASTRNYDLNSALAPGQNILALRNAGFSDGVYKPYSYELSATTWTTGANYRFSKRFSTFARYMSGYRMPISDDWVPNVLAGKNDTGPINRINQVESGVKYASKKLSVFATLIATKLKNQLFQGLAAQPDGSLKTDNVLRDTNSNGLEVEVFYTPVNPLSLHCVATVQDVSIASSNLITNPANPADVLNIKGNRIRNIPKHYFIADATYRLPSFSFGDLSANLYWEYTSNTPIDEANRAFVPPYSVFNGGFTFTRDNISVRLRVRNILNNDALINGDARSSQTFADPTAVYLNAREISPRSIVGSISYSF